MLFTKYDDEIILKSIHKAAQSVDYGEVRIKIDKMAPKMEVIIETQEKLRFDKKQETII